jgi:hypothetical protein
MRALTIGGLVLWVAASAGTPASGPADAVPEAAHVDPHGRVWVWRPGDRPEAGWSRLDGVDDAVAASILGDDVFVARRAGPLVRWNAGSAHAEQVPGIVDVLRLSCGASHCLAATAGGRAFAWGSHDHGQLGSGSREWGVPVEPRGLAEVVDVAAGADHSLAVTDSGRVFAWGANDRGQLGQGDRGGWAEPREVPGIAGARACAAGAGRSAVVLADGTLRAWGDQANAVDAWADSDGRVATVAASESVTVATTFDGELLLRGESGLAAPGASEDWADVRGFARSVIALDGDGGVSLLRDGAVLRFPAETFEAGMAVASSPAAPPPLPLGQGMAYVIVGDPALDRGDQALVARLEGLGLTVVQARDGEVRAEDVSSASVVVISRSAQAVHVPQELAGLAVPLVILDAFAVARLGLTSENRVPHGRTRSDALAVVRPTHPLAGGLRGTPKVTGRPAFMPWAIPRGGSQVAAVTVSGEPAAFGYETGDDRAATPVPARRAALLLPPPAAGYNADAWTLFDAAMRWALGREAAETDPPLLPPTSGTGTILLVTKPGVIAAPDTVFKTRMEAMGFAVQVVPQDSPTLNAGSANDKVLVFVSGTVTASTVAGMFREVAKPVVIQNRGFLDNMDMMATPGGQALANSAKTVVLATGTTHPIGGGLTGTLLISTVPGPTGWGTPTGAGVRILHVFGEDGTHSPLFTYVQGAVMANSFAAPERRVFYGFGDPIHSSYTTIGGDVFDRMVFWATGQNLPPTVSAGPDRAVTDSNPSLTLSGSVVDDGLPAPPTLTRNWTMVEGPGVVTFGTPNAAITTASFSVGGVYVLRLTAHDTLLSAFDEVTVTRHVDGTNSPPVVNAGADATVDVTSGTFLVGAVVDDGLPTTGGLTYAWSKLSGPGSVTFGTPTDLATTALFSADGIYVLRLTANDGALAAYDDVVVKVNANALLVVGNTTPLSAGDAYLKGRIQALGWPVVVKSASDVLTVDAGQKKFVWVSATAPEAHVGDKFQTVGVPVGIQTAGLLDNMWMVSGGGNSGEMPDQTQGLVLTPAHPIAAGLTGMVPLNVTPAVHGWGTPNGNGAKVIVNPAHQTRAPVFVYENQANMPGGVANERRALFGVAESGMSSLTLEGKRVLDATIHWLARTNAPPWANAGPDITLSLMARSVTHTLVASVVDDGLGMPNGTLTARWSQVSGPAPMTFGSIHQAATTATFAAAGDYVLRLTASDGVYSHSDVVAVSVLATAPNTAPSVSAGPDRTVCHPCSLSLSALAADDGLPTPGVLTYSWGKVSGPGAATFTPPNAAATSVTFTQAGVYVLRVTVNDGLLSAADDVQVTVDTSKQALLVVGSVVPLNPEDVIAKAELEALGYGVTLLVDADADDAAGKDVVLISATANSIGIGQRFRDVPEPVLVWEQLLWDDMEMATNVSAQQNMTTVHVVLPSHPLAAGLNGLVPIYSTPGDMGGGVAGTSAITVARLLFLNMDAVFAYEEGMPMATGLLAPARRVGLCLRPNRLNTEGLLLFRAAIRWAAEKRVSSLLVTGSTTLNPSDAALRDRLNGLGYPVTTVTSQHVNSGSTTGKAVVVVAPSAIPAELGTKLRDVAVPVIVAAAGAFGNMAMTAPADFGSLAGQTKVAVVDSFHPLSANLSGARTVVSPAATFSWGVPAASAAKVATLELDASKSTVFGYEARAMMLSGVTALERRTGLWLGPGSAEALTGDGAALVNAAVTWSANSDGDRDGLSFANEIRLGANPADPDTNDDGLLDGAAFNAGLSVTATDMDGDGALNSAELVAGTNPFLWDTDGDGHGDLAGTGELLGTDCYPLDPARWLCPPIPGDTTPPDIDLIEPVGAILISSVPRR